MNKIYILYKDLNFKNQIQYTFSVLFFILGIEIEYITDINEKLLEKNLVINYSDFTIKEKI